MVKKRSRKNDNGNATDEEFVVDDIEDNPPPAKKYSLRTRSSTRNLKPVFTFDDGSEDEEEETIIKKESDDDEDYKVDDDDEDYKVDDDDEDEEVVGEPSDEEFVQEVKRNKPGNRSNSKSCTRVSPLREEPSNITIETREINPKYETDNGPANADGLIDFEDMIRADIVVVKGKEDVDYDSLIQQTMIRQSELENLKKAEEEKTKATSENVKAEADDDDDYDQQPNIFEPEIETLTELENQDSLFLSNGGSDDPPPTVRVITEIIDNTISNSPEIPTAPAIASSNPDGEPLNENQSQTTCDPLKNDDDDVIVLGEMKTPLIVLDD